jgi:hypothetical protein
MLSQSRVVRRPAHARVELRSRGAGVLVAAGPPRGFVNSDASSGLPRGLGDGRTTATPGGRGPRSMSPCPAGSPTAPPPHPFARRALPARPRFGAPAG